jgi:UDP-N-acetylmuramate--alanine ligase
MDMQQKVKEILNSPQGVGIVYFIGIGGIGMSALARYFKSLNKEVSGYDKTETTLTKELVIEGIKVHYNDDLNLIPKDADLVIYTPAVPQDHEELNYFRDNNYAVVKRSDVLGAITADRFNICIGGTHGKTTISAMTAHILRHTGYGCNAFLGGISTNYETNFWSSENETCVVEADEYDRSFLKLSPDIAVITSMDADHLDIYGTEENLQDAFVEFGSKVKEGGLFIGRHGLKKLSEVKASRKLSYSLQNEAADVFASEIKIDEGGYEFSVQVAGNSISNLKLNVGGMHNVENMVAAITVAHELDIDTDKIREAVKAYEGVKRRFEYILPPQKQQPGHYVYPVFIDDYAHHPQELKVLLKSARSLFPQRKLTVVFQPHLFSRTKDHADDFASVLSMADDVILLPIYPAREKPIDGVSSEMILNRITAKEKHLVQKEEFLKWMEEHLKNINKEFGEVIITAGAGDIDTLVQPLQKIIYQA